MKIKILKKEINLEKWRLILGILVSICALIVYLKSCTDFFIPDSIDRCRLNISLNDYKKAESNLLYSLNNTRAKHEKIFDYFVETNPKLIRRLNEIKTKKTSGTYIPAEAGFGKSWIGLKIIKQEIAESELSILDIKKDFVNKNKNELAEKGIKKFELDDLTITNNNDNSKIVLNKIVSFEENFDKLLSLVDTTKKYIVIDGLDEIHPNKAKSLLNEIESRMNLKDKHFFILARPETFSMRKINKESENLNIELLESLSPIKYESFSDVKKRADNWIDYYPKVRQISKLSQEDSITIINNLVNIIKQKPFLKHSIINSSNGFDLVEYLISNRNIEFEKLSDYELMNTLKDGIFIRNSLTHKRPTLKEDNTNLYFALFAKIASNYSKDIESDNGYFKVKSLEVLNVVYLNKEYRFNVKEALNLSGIVKIKPANSAYSKYSFQPLWLHKYFIEYANKNCIE